ncbi:MAG: glycosyl hydrolase family 28-related protein, partial [Planctomycetota bacterium]
MMKKLTMLLMVAVLVAAAQADVYIVSESTKAGGPEEAAAMSAFLNANFTSEELGTIYTDNYVGGAPAAGAGDLVIFCRTLYNGGYDDSSAEIAGWNNLAAGILMVSPYQADMDNLGWSTTGVQPSGVWGAGAETAVLSPGDPLFAGVTVTGGYADLITDTSTYLANGASAFSAFDVVGSTDGGQIVLARITAGSAWNCTSPVTSGTHGGDRIVFQYAVEPAASGGGLNDDLTADGIIVLGNAIAELLDATGPPTFTSDPINEINATEDVAYSSSIADNAYDRDSDPMTFSKVSGPTWLSVAADGSLSGTPSSSDPGLNVFTVQVDTIDGSDTATLNIMVLDATPDGYDVTSYGAIGDGIVNDTAAINSAIDAANAAGGGTVIFPTGNYAAASIQLKSNVTLHLTSEAAIVARSDGYNAWEYNPYDEGVMDSAYYHWEASLIWGENLTNVAIEGTGIIDGSSLRKSSSHVNGTGDKGVALKLCDGVTIKNVSFWVDDTIGYEGPHYMILLTGCDNVTIDNISVQTKRDAINLMNCRDALIENCYLDSVRGDFDGGDDGIKLGSDYSLGYVRDSYNITVRNCTIMAGTNALQFGTETLGPFSNISFENITITAAGKAGCGITANDGSVIDGVTYSDITMSGVLTPFFIKVSDVARVPSGHTYSTGAIKNVSFTNITATDILSRHGEMPVVLWGKTNSYIENVVFDNVDFTVKGGQPFSVAATLPPENDERFPQNIIQEILKGPFPSYAYYLRHVKGLQFYNGCSVAFESNDDRPAFIIDDGTTSATLGGVELDGV